MPKIPLQIADSVQTIASWQPGSSADASPSASPLVQLEEELRSASASALLYGWGIEERKQFIRGIEAGFAEAFPVGTSIIVHLGSFNFVDAETGVLALKRFVEIFGGNAKGWAFDIGRPMMMGAVFG